MVFCPGIIHFQDCDFLICSLKLVLHDQGPAFSSSLFGAKCPSSLFFSQLSCKGSSNYIERPSPFSSDKFLSALGSISNVTSLRRLPLPPGLGLSSQLCPHLCPILTNLHHLVAPIVIVMCSYLLSASLQRT